MALPPRRAHPSARQPAAKPGAPAQAPSARQPAVKPATAPQPRQAPPRPAPPEVEKAATDPFLDPLGEDGHDRIATTVVTNSNAPVLAGQLDQIIKPTSVDQLIREGKTRNLKAVKESQLRELIRQSVNQVLSTRAEGGHPVDEALLDQVQADLKRTLAARQQDEEDRAGIEARAAALNEECERLRRQLAEARSSPPPAADGDAQARLQAAEQRAAALERERDLGRARIVALENDVRDSERQAEAAEQAAQAAMARAAAAERDLQAARARQAPPLTPVAATGPDPASRELIAAATALDRDRFGGRFLRENARSGGIGHEARGGARAVAEADARLGRVRALLLAADHDSALDAADEPKLIEAMVAARERDQEWIGELQRRLKEAQAARELAEAEKARLAAAPPPAPAAADPDRLERLSADLVRTQAERDQARAAAQRLPALEQQVRDLDRRAQTAEGRLAAALAQAAGAEDAQARAARLEGELARARAHAATLQSEVQAARSAPAPAAVAGSGDSAQRLASLAATVDEIRDRLRAMTPRPSSPVQGSPAAAGVAFAGAGGRLRLVAASAEGRPRLLADDGHGLAASVLPAEPPTMRSEAIGWHRRLDRTDRIAWIAVDGSVREAVRGSSACRDLCQAAQAPRAAGRRLAVAADSAGDRVMLAYRGEDGQPHVLMGGDGAWRHLRPAGAPADLAISDDLTAWWWPREDSWHLAASDARGQIHELFQLGGAWRYALLTAQALGPAAAGGLRGYAPGEVEHLLYRGNDGSLHELVYDGGWHHHALGMLAGAPAADGVPDGGYRGGHHVVAFRGRDGGLHALTFTGAWRHHALSGIQAAGDPVLAPGDTALVLALDRDQAWRALPADGSAPALRLG